MGTEKPDLLRAYTYYYFFSSGPFQRFNEASWENSRKKEKAERKFQEGISMVVTKKTTALCLQESLPGAAHRSLRKDGREGK